MKRLTILALLVGVACQAQPVKSLDSYVDEEILIAPFRVTGNTATSGSIIDLNEYKYAEIYLVAGTMADADATFTLSLAHGDVIDTTGTTITDSAAVTASELTAAFSTVLFSQDNTIQARGYVGGKRYIKATITPASNSGNADLAAILVGRKWIVN